MLPGSTVYDLSTSKIHVYIGLYSISKNIMFTYHTRTRARIRMYVCMNICMRMNLICVCECVRAYRLPI